MTSITWHGTVQTHMAHDTGCRLDTRLSFWGSLVALWGSPCQAPLDMRHVPLALLISRSVCPVFATAAGLVAMASRVPWLVLWSRGGPPVIQSCQVSRAGAVMRTVTR